VSTAVPVMPVAGVVGGGIIIRALGVDDRQEAADGRRAPKLEVILLLLMILILLLINNWNTGSRLRSGS
jgi:hypothetical protein